MASLFHPLARLFLSICFCLGMLAAPAFACNEPDLVQRAFGQLQGARERMLALRGFSDGPKRAGTSVHHVQKITGLLKRQGVPSALLAYAEIDGAICAMIFDEKGFVGGSRITLDPREIEAWLADVARTMGTERTAALRAPRRRGSLPSPAGAAPAAKLDHGELAAAIRQLSDGLLPTPLSAMLDGKEQLFVLPVRNIGTVPFALLQRSPQAPPLIQEMAIAIVPGIQEIGITAAPPWSPPRSALVVGNPDFRQETEWELEPLPGAEREAIEVGRLIQTQPLLGDAATHDVVLQRLGGADLIYLATHAIADTDAPLDAGFLALTGGRLTPREIQRLDLSRSQIAVLSACQTGLGLAHDAGVVGLARAFVLARVPTVVMSLWSVDDASTAMLATSFMRHLAELPAPRAMRAAMLETRRAYPHPVQWAAFTLFATR